MCGSGEPLAELIGPEGIEELGHRIPFLSPLFFIVEGLIDIRFGTVIRHVDRFVDSRGEDYDARMDIR